MHYPPASKLIAGFSPGHKASSNTSYNSTEDQTATYDHFMELKKIQCILRNTSKTPDLAPVIVLDEDAAVDMPLLTSTLCQQCRNLLGEIPG